MPIIERKTTASLQGICTIDDNEPLIQWLLAHPRGKVQLKDCVNLHSAIVQTLMMGQVQCLSWPADTNLREWLQTALSRNTTTTRSPE